MTDRKSLGQRGRALERKIKQLFERYSERGIHCQENHPEQLAGGTFVGQHGFDFQIFYKGKMIAFDAKMCEIPRLGIANLKLHQINEMVKIIEHGGEGFFMIYFVNENKLVRLDADKARDMIKNGVKSIGVDDGVKLKGINILEL